MAGFASCAVNPIDGTLGRLCCLLPCGASDCHLELGAKNARKTVARCVGAWGHRHRTDQHETARLHIGAMAVGASAVSTRAPVGGRWDAAQRGTMGTTGVRGAQVALSPGASWALTPLPWLAPACGTCGQGRGRARCRGAPDALVGCRPAPSLLGGRRSPTLSAGNAGGAEGGGGWGGAFLCDRLCGDLNLGEHRRAARWPMANHGGGIGGPFVRSCMDKWSYLGLATRAVTPGAYVVRLARTSGGGGVIGALSGRSDRQHATRTGAVVFWPPWSSGRGA